MPLPDDLSMRTATLRDLPAIAELRLAVGMTPHDWALRLAIQPRNAQSLVVEDRAGRLVGAGSGVAYRPLGIVGNMMVAEDRRREGVGSAVLDAVADFLHEEGCARLELYATQQGWPLYTRQGFSPIAPGSRAHFARDVLLPPPSRDVVVSDGDERALDSLVDFDTPRFGGDRSALMRAILADRHRPALVASRGAMVVGFGWVRVDEGRIGPWVTDEPEVAAAILAEAFRRVADRPELTANIPTSNRRAVEWLRGLGVDPDLWDGRMARGAPIPRREESIYGSTSGALG